LLAQTLVQFSDVESGVVQVCVNHHKLIARLRLENASRRCGGIILSAPEKPLQDHPMIQPEIREMERAIADFKAAIQRGETVGAVDRGLSKRDSD
jgi:hypothetical protein